MSVGFQGILTLSRGLVDQLDRYLEECESKTCQALLNTVGAELIAPGTAPFLPVAAQALRFSESIELVGKKVRQAGSGPKSIAVAISKALWDYLEILEGSVTELFQQLDQVGVEDWSMELKGIVDAIKEILLHRLDDMNWVIQRLEHQLRDYIEPKSGLKKLCCFWQCTLDKSLLPNLEKCRKYLGFRYKKFSDQYERYLIMHTTIELAVDKFSDGQVFGRLDPDTQDKFRKLYRLISLWQLNSKERALSRGDTARAVRNAMSPDRVESLFRDYDKQLWRSLFEKSELIKELPEERLHRGNITRLNEQIAGFRQELHTLFTTVTTYRDFLLKDSKADHFTRICNDLKHLDHAMEAFIGQPSQKAIAEIDPAVQSVLHEMAQPLISRPTMKMRSEHFIRLLEQLNILANIDKKAVEYVGKSLNRAMRADWQFQTLFDQPSFHQLYALYCGLIGQVTERSHLNRMQKFKRLIQQLEHWVKSHDTPRHTHEIELDLNDMKGYLQDFLAYTQRIWREEGVEREKRLAEASQQLLEYRYLFGNFFHHLLDESPESRHLRKQLLFADQYFEAVDHALSRSLQDL